MKEAALQTSLRLLNASRHKAQWSMSHCKSAARLMRAGTWTYVFEARRRLLDSSLALIYLM